MSATQILTVDDHPAFQRGLVYMMDSQPDLEICGQAGSVPEAMELVEEMNPDLVVTDLSLPDQGGLDLIKLLKIERPQLPVLVISMHDELLYAERVLRAGGRGYLMKEQSDQVIEAIRSILKGGLHVSPAVSKHFQSVFNEGDKIRYSFPLSRLSARELEIFQLMGSGHSSHEIGTRLDISIRTVDAHRTKIRQKLRVRDASELMLYAIRWAEAGRMVGEK